MADIDLKQMERLMAMMLQNEITELHYQHGELRIELKRAQEVVTPVITATTMPAAQFTAPQAAPPVPSPAEPDADAGLVPIASPMVGTYYEASDPDTPPFVKVGSTVTQDTTVCLIEAMKVFNEIKAEVDGTVERIVVRNADAVEYGQALYMVRPK